MYIFSDSIKSAQPKRNNNEMEIKNYYSVHLLNSINLKLNVYEPTEIAMRKRKGVSCVRQWTIASCVNYF